jgi:hypothetical protein
MAANKLFLYEHKSQPLLPLRLFYQRVLRNVLIACAVLAFCLIIGTAGYHQWATADPKIAWVDAFHNASMILSGMGPVITIDTNSGKIFSSLYALFSGVVFITNIGVILAPAIHRLFHRLHLQEH